MDSYGREESIIEDQYEDGLISRQQADRQLGDLARDHRAAAEEAAWAAYDQAMEDF